MTHTASDRTTLLRRYCLWGLCALALYQCSRTMLAIAKRVTFPSDFVPWPDDYVLNQLIKLRFGEPLYGSFEDANSFVYAPGSVLLHRALLAPLGLDVDIVANRVLTQIWLLLAVVLGVRLVGLVSEHRFERRAESIVAAIGAGAGLALASYSSSIAETLHPGMLELLVLTVTAGIAAQWPRFSFRARLLLGLLLPACGMLARQTGGSIAFALAGVAVLSRVGSLRQRLATAALCLVSPALTLAGLQLATHGAFARWGLWLPISQPRTWTNLLFVRAILAAIAPALVLVLLRAGRTFAHHMQQADAAWWRALAIPLAHAPISLLPFLKIGGGMYDFGAIAFFAVLFGMAELRTALASRSSVAPLLVTSIAALQLVVWSPHRPSPSAADVAFTKHVCAHIREALACGERVYVDAGVSCLIESGVTSTPRDRGFTMLELAWAGNHDQPGLARRIGAEYYDLLAFHAGLGAWSPDTRSQLALHYAAYAGVPAVPLAMPGDLDLNDRARPAAWTQPGVVFYERKLDAGRHRRTIVGAARCGTPIEETPLTASPVASETRAPLRP